MHLNNYSTLSELIRSEIGTPTLQILARLSQNKNEFRFRNGYKLPNVNIFSNNKNIVFNQIMNIENFGHDFEIVLHLHAVDSATKLCVPTLTAFP